MIRHYTPHHFSETCLYPSVSPHPRMILIWHTMNTARTRTGDMRSPGTTSGPDQCNFYTYAPGRVPVPTDDIINKTSTRYK